MITVPGAIKLALCHVSTLKYRKGTTPYKRTSTTIHNLLYELCIIPSSEIFLREVYLCEFCEAMSGRTNLYRTILVSHEIQDTRLINKNRIYMYIYIIIVN